MKRHTQVVIYALAFASSAILLYQGRTMGLFPAPSVGTDQQAMLAAAGRLAAGELPGGDYRYSYAYTVFLALLHLLTGGSLFWMRLLQAAVCAFIPVLIYRSARLMRLGKTAGLCGALCYIFYGPALLISVDFLRAAPLGLVFLGSFYLLLLGWHRRSGGCLIGAGALAAVCVLGRENFAPVVLLPALGWFFPEVRARFGRGGIYRYLAAALLPVLAVMAFNWIRFGSFQPVPGNAANIMAFYHGGAAAGVGERAISLLKSVPVQFCNYLSNYELPNSLSFYAHRELIYFLRIFALPFHVLTLLALTGLWIQRRNRAALLAGVLIAGYAGSLLFFTIFYRFRIPAVPLEAVLAGAGIYGVFRWVKHRAWRELMCFAVGGGIFLVLTWADVDARREFSERAAVSRLLIDQQRYGEAEEYLLKMIADGHDVRAGALLLVQRLYEEAGDPAGAQMAAERLGRALAESDIH